MPEPKPQPSSEDADKEHADKPDDEVTLPEAVHIEEEGEPEGANFA